MSNHFTPESVKESFYELVKKATAQALNEGIKANSIVINENMVRVPEFGMRDPIMGRPMWMPRMICGLNVYLSTNELPEGYSFAVMDAPNNRLAQFESIGMEPDELKKAAELYRRIKEAME